MDVIHVQHPEVLPNHLAVGCPVPVWLVVSPYSGNNIINIMIMIHTGNSAYYQNCLNTWCLNHLCGWGIFVETCKYSLIFISFLPNSPKIISFGNHTVTKIQRKVCKEFGWKISTWSKWINVLSIEITCSNILDSVNFTFHHFSVEMHVFSRFEQLLVILYGYLDEASSNKDAFQHRVFWSRLLGRMLWILG